MNTADARHSPGQDGFAVENLRFTLGTRTILLDLRLRVAPGEFIGLLGPSGSGKTSLLRLLAGLETPAFGSVTWNGRDAAGQGLERGAVFEDCGFVPWLSLSDNMAMAIDAARPGTSSLRCQELAREYLHLVGLIEVGHKHPLELSRGMRQQAAMARALAMGSPVLLLDDPFCVLDPRERALIHDLLPRIQAAAEPRTTIVLATHDLDDALSLATRVIGLGAVPGPIVVDMTVPGPGTPDGSRADIPERTLLRRRIEDLYHQDDRRRLAAEEFFGLGAGI